VAPPRGECRFCGGAPAVHVDLRWERSGPLNAIFFGGSFSEHGPVCGPCGLTVLRDMTDVALRGGRPGLLTFGWLFNLLTVLGNAQFWFRLRRLKAPVRDPAVRTPLLSPMDPGRSLLVRPGMLGLYLTVAVLGLGVAAALFVGSRL
jgi:hypothetical protein